MTDRERRTGHLDALLLDVGVNFLQGSTDEGSGLRLVDGRSHCQDPLEALGVAEIAHVTAA
jgi:hypothetical protein